MLALLLLAALHAGTPPRAEELLDRARGLLAVEGAVERARLEIEGPGGPQWRAFELRLRRDPDALRLYLRVLGPPELAGTALVLVDHPGREDPLLLYLPALGRVRRLAGEARQGSLLGSGLRYADLELDFGPLRSSAVEPLGGGGWRLRLEPASGEWSRVELDFPGGGELPRSARWFDRQGRLTRELEVLETRRVEERAVPWVLELRSADGGRSRLELEELDLHPPPELLDPELFTPAGLERGAE